MKKNAGIFPVSLRSISIGATRVRPVFTAGPFKEQHHFSKHVFCSSFFKRSAEKRRMSRDGGDAAGGETLYKSKTCNTVGHIYQTVIKGVVGLPWFACIIFLLFISSCQKDFNINPGNAGNEVVVNSLWNDGGPMVVYLSKSYPVGTTNFNITSIPNAQIELYEDNTFKEILHYVPSDTQALFGAYLSNLTPQYGKNYTIKATTAGYLTATAADQVPVPAQLITNALQQYDDTITNTAKMYMVFKDNLAAANYYRINVFIYGHMVANNVSDTFFNNYAIAPYPLSPVNDTVRDGLFLLFSDRGFNGQEKNLGLSFNTINRRGYLDLTVDVELHTVSYAHYDYFETLNQYRNANNSSSEPVFIYSNINNGLGIFVAEHIQRMTFAIK